MKVVKMTQIGTKKYYEDKLDKHWHFRDSYFVPGKTLYPGQLNNKNSNLHGSYIDDLKNFHHLIHTSSYENPASIQALETILKHVDDVRRQLEA